MYRIEHRFCDSLIFICDSASFRLTEEEEEEKKVNSNVSMAFILFGNFQPHFVDFFLSFESSSSASFENASNSFNLLVGVSISKAIPCRCDRSN